MTFVSVAGTYDQIVGRFERVLSDESLGTYLESEMNPHFHDRTLKRFQSEGDSASGAWAPLAEATNFIRVSLGFPPEHPINVRTQQLYYWMLEDGDHHDDELGPRLTFPSSDTHSDPENQRKFQVAQQGNDAPDTPPRPVLAVDEEDFAFFVTSFLAFFIEQVSIA